MKLLHTSDWHVGRTIRGRDRSGEHQAVLAEIAAIAADQAVDVVLVTGDLFDTAAPTPESERIVYRALLDLEATATVVVIAGNHDNERRLQAIEPLLQRGRIITSARFALPPEGVAEIRTATGEEVQIALLPFMSQRTALRADELMAQDASDHVQAYAATIEDAVARLSAAFRPGAVHVIAAHLFAHGGLVGGSERLAHTVMGYAVSPHVFPPSAHYVALGHLHRPQSVGPAFVRYAGSPLQLDFGEAGETKSVTVVQASPSAPAHTTQVPLTSGRRLRVVQGTMAQLQALADGGGTGDDHLKIVVREPARAGLADDVRVLFEHCVDVVVEAPPASGQSRARPTRRGQAPTELLHAYLQAHDVDDARLEALFAGLFEEATSDG